MAAVAKRWAPIVVAAAVAVVGSAVPAAAAAEGVTLEASRTKLRFGTTTNLTGAIDPPAAGEEVTLVNSAGAEVATTATDEAGAFAVKLTPRRNLTLNARWSTFTSSPVTIRVRPAAEVKLGAVPLFGRARVRGHVRPSLVGRRVTVKLLRWGHAVGTKRVRLRAGRWFSTRIRVPAPGTYRARLVVRSPHHLRARARSVRRTTAIPDLSVGSSGGAVRLLEARLRHLGYYLPRADRNFDHKTADALRAFNKVQRTARAGSVNEATWRRLASPVRPRPHHRRRGLYIEIDQTRQVIFTVRKGRVTHILHTSTGANGATHDGAYRVHRKLAGTSGGGLYYPSYFDGLRAIHGWPDVPVYPASHGCARVPMWAATWIHSQAPLGTRVFVYH